MKSSAKTIRFPDSLEYEINEFARLHKLTFSAAVIELCNRSLYRTFDGHYAPKIAQCIQDENYKILKHIETLLQMYSEESTDRILLYQKYLLSQLLEEAQEE